MAKPSRKKRRASPVEVPANIVDENTNQSKPKSGRPSYANKAKKLGLYNKITYTIMCIRKENIGVSNRDIYRTLNGMYPEVFDKEEMDGGNATKILKSDPMWEMALGINKDNENTFAEIRFFSIFHKEDAKDSDIIRAYKALKDIDIKSKLTEQAIKGDLEIAVSFNVKEYDEEFEQELAKAKAGGIIG